MKNTFLRFALFLGAFLAGFVAPAMADDLPSYQTLDLTLKVSKYTGNEGGMVSFSNFFVTGQNPTGPVGFVTETSHRMTADVRGPEKFNQVIVYAKPNPGYTFKWWADADKKTDIPSRATTEKETIHWGMAGYLKRQLCQNPSDASQSRDGYFGAFFHFHVSGNFIDEHHPKYTLYAVFTPNEYTVTYIPNGGTVTPTSKTVTYNAKYGVLPTPVRSAFIFAGWYLDEACTTSPVGANTNCTTPANHNLYAKWTPITHAIHFVDQEQSKTFDDATYSGVSMPTLAKTNYLPEVTDEYFAGFYTKPYGQGTRVYAGTSTDGTNLDCLNPLTLTDDITLYAHYAHVHHNMYWDYSYDNGEKEAGSTTTWHNMNSTEYLKYARLTFKKANGDDIKTVILEATAPTVVKPIESMSSELSTHTTSSADIQLLAGSGTDVLNTQEVKIYFTDAELASFAAYTFEAISAKEPVTVATNWVVTTHKDSHNTVLNYIGATGTNIYQQAWSVELNGLLINPDYIYVMPIYEVSAGNWAAISQLTHTYGVQCIKTDETSIDTEGHKKATYTGSYPVWIKNNGGDYYNNAIGLVGFNMGGKNFFMNTTNPGTFSEFYNSATATTPFVVAPGTNTGETQSVTINYTVPASKIPVIHFLPGAADAHLGAETQEYMVKAYGEQIANLAASYTATRPGYVFNGWEESDGTAIETPMTVDRAYTVVAQWEGAPYTVALYDNGGQGGMTEVTAKYMEAMPTLGTLPTRTGYAFKGYLDITNTYYYNNDGTSARAYDKMANSEMWATWQANTYTVTLDYQNGTGHTESVTATYDEALSNVTIPERLGYSFLGYFDAETEGTQYINMDGVGTRVWDKTADNVTLYAQWAVNHVTLTAHQDQNDPQYYYTTFYTSYTACQIITETAEAMIAEDAVDGTLHTKAIDGDIIPAGEAVLLRAEVNEIMLVPVSSELEKDATNVLMGVDEQTEQENGYIYYIFSDGPANGDHQIGFYRYEWYDTDGVTVIKGKLTANRAFYRAAVGSPSASPRRYVINRNDVVTDVENTEIMSAPVNKMIINDQLVIERDGIRYNAMGMVIE